MFFADYTTQVEQRRGIADADLLIARHREDGDNFFRGSALGHGTVEASVQVGESVYELSIDLSVTASEHDGINLTDMDVDADTRETGSQSTLRLPSKDVPLNWSALVSVLCSVYDLDPSVVWSTGVDVQAYWHDQGENEYLKVPRDADRARYSLKHLHSHSV